MITIKFTSIRQSVLEQEKVIDAMARATNRALNRFGAFVRQRAITSMLGHKTGKGFGMKSKVTNRGGSSPPGSPPTPHTGLLVKGIGFETESNTNVIIGPGKLNGTKSDTALAALEHGGLSLVSRFGKSEKVYIEARPFMQPAFDAEIDNAPYLWKNGIR